jgi:hypothetical protein
MWKHNWKSPILKIDFIGDKKAMKIESDIIGLIFNPNDRLFNN